MALFKAVVWALIFLTKLRFPPGVSIAIVYVSWCLCTWVGKESIILCACDCTSDTNNVGPEYCIRVLFDVCTGCQKRS